MTRAALRFSLPLCVLLSAPPFQQAQTAVPVQPAADPATLPAAETEVEPAPAPVSGAPGLITPAQKEKILKQIEDMESSLKNSKSSKIDTALSAFQSGAASEKAAYDLFLACQKELNFKDAKEAEFREWRDRNEGKFKTHSHMTALKGQLAYLVLSVKALRASEISRLYPELREYIRAAVANKKELAGDINVLRDSAASSVFARVYEVDRYFDLEGWTMSPLDLNAQYSEVLIPFAKDFTPKSVVTLWDERISLEKALLNEEDTKQIEQFTEQRLPQFLWERAKDRLSLGDEVQGYSDMLRILRENPGHPNATGWLADLKKLIDPPKIQPASADQTAPVRVN